MPHYSGTANSYSDLRTALFDACVAHGWTLTGDILTKGDAAVQATISATSSGAQGTGILIQGGTGISGSALVNPSPIRPRFGPMQTVVNQPSFPMDYDIHIFTSPVDEVYLVAKFNVEYYYWLAFGISTIPPGAGANGLWLSASSRGGQGYIGSQNGVNIGVDSGGSNANNSGSSAAIFWNTSQPTSANAHYANDTICVNLGGHLWAGNPSSPSPAVAGGFNAILAATTLLLRQPNAWNAEAVLNRIQGLFWYTNNKSALVCDLAHARYVRIDNYLPGQIITLGSDQWRVYPFYRKNASARDGGTTIDHTGTFGWAIKYDGV